MLADDSSQPGYFFDRMVSTCLSVSSYIVYPTYLSYATILDNDFSIPDCLINELCQQEEPAEKI